MKTAILHRAIRARGRPFVDPIHDATFMMDGSASAQTFARRLGQAHQTVRPGQVGEAVVAEVQGELHHSRSATAAR